MNPEHEHFGRPREHDRKKIAIDMIEWAKKPDSINLNKFCAYYEPIIPPSRISQWAKEDEHFRQAYQSAKMFLGFRREEMLNKNELHVKAYDLNATVYDQFLKDEKRQQAEFESSLREKEEGVKQSTYVIQVSNDLSAGSNIPTASVPMPSNKGS